MSSVPGDRPAGVHLCEAAIVGVSDGLEFLFQVLGLFDQGQQGHFEQGVLVAFGGCAMGLADVAEEEVGGLGGLGEVGRVHRFVVLLLDDANIRRSIYSRQIINVNKC